MHDQPLLTWARARRLLAAHLRPAQYGPPRPLRVETLPVHGEPISAARARAGDYAPFAVGEAWGAAWDTAWFRLRGTLPAEWAGEEVVARLGLGYLGQTGFGAEALVWDGDLPRQGVSPDHDEVVVARSARGGEDVELLVEAAANPVINQEQASWPLLHPDPGGAPLFRLSRAELCVVHREVEAFCRDLEVVLDLSEHLGGEGARAGQLLAALRRACILIDPENLRASLPAASAALRQVLCDSPGAPRRHRVVAQAHAHIDTAWLWPLRETTRKCARSFSTVLALMEDDPSLRFAASQMQQYAWVQRDYPQLFARIRKRIAEGRWEVVGGMWVESDCNIAGAESLVRQVLHGMLYCIEELGVEPRVGWLPDTFGFPGTLPQILREAGMPWFVTQKISWNQSNAFPHSSFWWEGLDGSRVLTHFPPVATYNGDASATEVLRTERQFRDHGVASSSLYLFGLGDGGGGPTQAMLQRLQRMSDVDGLPLLEQSTSQAFFERTERESGDQLATWRGEMYLERHRGVFTSQAAVKRDNRNAERLLREAELLACLHPDGLDAYPAAELDEAWKLALLHQFHDILPGSSINLVYQESARDHARVRALAEQCIDAAAQALAARVDTSGMSRPVLVANASSFPRRELVEVGEKDVLVEVPACGYAVVDADAATPPDDVVEVGQNWMANAALRVEWDGDGLLTSVYDRRAGREVLAPGARGNLLQVFRDHPADYDAWEVDADDLEDPQELTACDALEVTERGPLRATLRVQRSHGRSRVVQQLSLAAHSPRLDVRTEVDWQESHRLLKVAFPVAVRADRAAFDVGFGHVLRATHQNTSWEAAQFEVPAHRFADISEHGYGVALLNDCKHGYDVRGNLLRLTLLRAPTAPDPQADLGRHLFTYALLPHRGDLTEGGVVQQAEALDLPLRVVPITAHAGDLPRSASAVRIVGDGDPTGVVVSAVKKAERGQALVLRVCEVAGGTTTVRLAPARPATAAARCDLLERPRQALDLDAEGAVSLTLAPFQLATLRFETP